MSNDALAAMAELPLFAELPPIQQLELAPLCRVKRYAKRASLFQEDEPVTGLFLVLDGVVKVTRCTTNGREVVLYLVRKGQAVGECGVFTRDTHPADAYAVQETKVLFVPAEALERLVRTSPHAALWLLTAMSLRLRMFVHKVKTERQGNATRRLAAYLLHRSQLHGNATSVCLEVSREELANLLGLARETLSRQLGKLVNLGAISLQGKTVTLQDKDELVRIAEGLAPELGDD